jgi:hypothetical protein
MEVVATMITCKNKKWTASLVTVTFLWLLQVSAMPLNADGPAAHVSSANEEPGPACIESVSHQAAPVPKKSIPPCLLIGAGVVAAAAVLFLAVFKVNYDIRGTWEVLVTWTGHDPADFEIVFSGGSRENGSFLELDYWVGTYMADGKEVTWKYMEHDMVFTGRFTGKDEIAGTASSTFPDYLTGTFKAVRTAAAASIKNTGPGGTGKEIK